MSASATFIAVIALVTAVYQAKLSRDQAKAAVWPYLIAGNSGEAGYSRIVQNVGLGPAIIGTFEVQVDGKPMHSWQQVADTLGIALSFKGSRSTTFRHGIVIPVGANVHILELPDSNDIRLMRSQVHRLTTYVCFCSLYGDCWALRGDIDEPQQLKQCVDDKARAFSD